MVAGSGSSYYAKGDVKTSDILFEGKHRAQIPKYLSELLEKITKEANAIGRKPCLELEVSDVMNCEQRWVMIPASMFQSLREAADAD